MRRIIFLAILAFVALPSQVNGQSAATASATATIVKPISIANNVDLNFGNIASNGTASTVVMGADGARVAGTGVTLPATKGTTTAAKFTVTGEGIYTYDLTLPVTITISNTDTTPATMVVNGFTSNSTKKLTGGTEVFFVGATLNLGISQAAGNYTNSNGFEVTVNYN